VTMSTPAWLIASMNPSDLTTLDYWTNVSIEAHFRELVKETQQANNTGASDMDSQETAPSGV